MQSEEDEDENESDENDEDEYHKDRKSKKHELNSTNTVTTNLKTPTSKQTVKAHKSIQKSTKKSSEAKLKNKPQTNIERDEVEYEANDEGGLFDIVMNHHGASLETAVLEWVDEYASNRSDAIVELINFLIEVC